MVEHDTTIQELAGDITKMTARLKDLENRPVGGGGGL